MAKSVNQLRQELKQCRGDAACLQRVEAAFTAEQGTSVLQIQGKVFMTSNKGSVFLTTDARVSPNGAKVF